jgi:integrase
MNNPRQIRLKTCGCPMCTAEYRPDEKPTRKDCTGTWQARYRDPSGKQCSENFATKKEAEEFLDDVRTSIRRGTYLDPKRSRIATRKWHAIWWPQQVGAASTMDRDERLWRCHIEPKWGGWPLISIGYMDVVGWVRDLERQLAPSSIYKVFQILDRMMTAARLDKRILSNPCDEVKLPKQKKKHPADRRPPTYEQLALVRAELPGYHHALQIVAQETGLRWGELAGLRLCNVDLGRARIEVREVLEEVGGKLTRKAYPKSDAGLRTVPLTPLAVEAIRAHLEQRPAVAARSELGDGMCAKELVFRGRSGAPLGRNHFRRLWVQCIQRAGVARKVKGDLGRVEWWPQFHKQRHAYASRLHDAGVPEVVVQEILGHERGGEVTWLYTHAAKDTAGQVLAALTGQHPPLRAVS